VVDSVVDVQVIAVVDVVDLGEVPRGMKRRSGNP